MEEDILESEIDSLEVTGFVKKGHDNVFIIEVVWSNGWAIEVSRRYSDFISLHRALLTLCHGSQSFPMLPTFNELFENVFDDEARIAQPNLDLLNDYCNCLSESNNQLIYAFFTSTQYDVSLKRRTEDYSDNDKPVSPMLPKLLVLTDYSHGTFNLRAGDIVTLIGQDKNDWSLVGLHHHEGAMQVGWLPSVCLLELGAEDDPLIQDLIILFNNELQHEDDSLYRYDPSLRPISSASHSSSHSCMSGDAVDIAREAITYFQYCLTDECFLSCPFSVDLLVNTGEKVTVIDKDTDGWWYVCTCSGDEGWLPSTVLEARRASIRKGKKESDIVYQPTFNRKHFCMVSKTYQAAHRDEVTVKAGDCVQLLYESLSGWWTIRLGRRTGLVPGIFITKQTGSSFQSTRKAFSIGFNSSLLSVPPPRRKAFASFVSPVTPPPSIEDVLQLNDSVTSQEEAVHKKASNQTRESLSMPTSPVMDEDSFSEDERWLFHKPISPPAHRLGSLETTYSSSVARKISLPCFESQSYDRTTSKSPIPGRFLTPQTHTPKPSLGEMGGVLELDTSRGASPLIGEMSDASIPNRFIVRSSTPSFERNKSPLTSPTESDQATKPRTRRYTSPTQGQFVVRSLGNVGRQYVVMSPPPLAPLPTPSPLSNILTDPPIDQCSVEYNSSSEQHTSDFRHILSNPLTDKTRQNEYSGNTTSVVSSDVYDIPNRISNERPIKTTATNRALPHQTSVQCEPSQSYSIVPRSASAPPFGETKKRRKKADLRATVVSDVSNVSSCVGARTVVFIPETETHL